MANRAEFLNLNPKSAREILWKTNTALRSAEKELAAIADVPKKGKRTVANTFEPLNRVSMIIAEARNRASLFSAAHPDSKIRAAAEKATQKLAEFFPRIYLRRDIYEAVQSVSPEGLDAEAKRFREKELLDFKLTGVDKSADVRREIQRLTRRGVKLGQAFDRNIKNDVRYVDLKPSELEGLPEDYRKAHAPNKHGMVRLSTQYPDYLPFMQYAKSDGARRRFNFLFLNRGWPKNDKVFRELLAVRRRQARLLGFKDWADYATVEKMTGSAKIVQAFLDQVDRLTKIRADRDYQLLLARKRKDDPKAKSIGSWESVYYDNLVAKEKIGFDSKEVRNYFQFKKVKAGVLKTAARLFGLDCQRVKASVWHKDAEAFNVFRGRKLIGLFYLDLHPRTGKYGHAACFDIRPGIHSKQLPEAALICNFSKELMSHDEVTTFFHEFGHLVHFILGGDQRWARYSGFATEWDFVEAPSQMLESWALDFGTLRQFAFHHKTGKPISRDLVSRMQKAENSGKGIWQRTAAFLRGAVAALPPGTVTCARGFARHHAARAEKIQPVRLFARDASACKLRPSERLLGALLHLYMVARHRGGHPDAFPKERHV